MRSDSVFARSPAEPDGTERYLVEGRAPRASPDGSWLAFVRGNRTSAALYLLDLRRSMEVRITP
jgi:Tol biopolymer transport system component